MESRSEELRKHKEIFFQQTFCDIFHRTAQLCPDKIAVAGDNCQVTYQELDEYSNFLARYLMREGIRKEDIVAIQSGRDPISIVCMLGIWKAGGAYCFLDDCYPEARNQALREECGWKITLTREYVKSIPWEKDEHFINRSERDNLAVIIYTSGSTSKPKGVMLEHKNVAAAISNFDRLGFTENDRTCVFPSFSFVASIFDIFSSLSVGATLEIIPEYRRRKMDLIVEFYRERQITIAFLPPHMARKFMKVDTTGIPLRALLVGSEPVRHLCQQPYRIINVYAASECCSLIAVYDITDDEEAYPIGTLNPTFRGYIVDENGKQVEPGTEGELWLAGPQVSRGYLKRPDVTSRQYIVNPFCDEPEYRRLFKTNDLVRQDADGNLHYIGRKDNMCKIRGFRVESGAVESTVLKCAAIKEVVVKAFADEGGTNILCGYFTSDVDIDVKDLKEKLRETLPYYMVPTCFIRLSEFPRNFNNKIDRKAIQPPKELNDHKLLEQLY